MKKYNSISSYFAIFVLLLMIGSYILNYFDNDNLLPILLFVIVTPLWCMAFTTFDKLDGDESSNKIFWYCFFGRIVVDVILFSIEPRLILVDLILMVIALFAAGIVAITNKDKEGMDKLLTDEPIVDLNQFTPLKYYGCLNCGTQFETDAKEIVEKCPKCGSKSITEKKLQ